MNEYYDYYFDKLIAMLAKTGIAACFVFVAFVIAYAIVGDC